MRYRTNLYTIVQIMSLKLRFIIYILGNWSKAQDKKPPGQNPPDNKHHSIIEEIIAKYAVNANLFQLEYTNSKKNSSPCFFWAFIPGAYCLRAFVRCIFVGGLLT